CPEGWKVFRGSCYFFNLASPFLSYDQAREDCKGRGANLTDVQDANEHSFLKRHISPDANIGYFIGLTDEAEEEVFVWQDGKKASYLDWGLSDPSGSTNENCVALHSSSSFKFVDISCADSLGHICKKTVTEGKVRI
ncbi:predicted protein, partial [Nematostella vectensis]